MGPKTHHQNKFLSYPIWFKSLQSPLRPPVRERSSTYKVSQIAIHLLPSQAQALNPSPETAQISVSPETEQGWG